MKIKVKASYDIERFAKRYAKDKLSAPMSTNETEENRLKRHEMAKKILDRITGCAVAKESFYD